MNSEPINTRGNFGDKCRKKRKQNKSPVEKSPKKIIGQLVLPFGVVAGSYLKYEHIRCCHKSCFAPLDACRGVSRRIIRCILVTQPFFSYSTSQDGLK